MNTNRNHFQRIALRIAQRIVIAVFVATNFLSPTAAHAESGYRYWSFWLNNESGWSLAQEGAGTLIPQDGDVHGWRFISAPDVAGPEYAPRSITTFDEVCGSIPAEAGKVRVALVVDFGDASDYSSEVSIPTLQTTCAVITQGDPASLALSQSHEVREEGGMVCAVDLLPASGCGETIEILPNQRAITMAVPAEDSTTPPTEEDDTLPQIVSIILGTIVFVMAWRRMQWQKQNKNK